jgi:hypothetical protein
MKLSYYQIHVQDANVEKMGMRTRYGSYKFLVMSFGLCNCRNPTLAKCGGEAQHLERVGIWSPPGLPNV